MKNSISTTVFYLNTTEYCVLHVENVTAHTFHRCRPCPHAVHRVVHRSVTCFRIGRKKALYFSVILSLAGGLGLAWTPNNFIVYCVIRFVNGFSMGGVFPITFVMSKYFRLLPVCFTHRLIFSFTTFSIYILVQKTNVKPISDWDNLHYSTINIIMYIYINICN